MYNVKVLKGLLFLCSICLFDSCATVAPSEKQYLDDGEMTLSLRKLEKQELNFQLYREASSGANGGKSGGGCGCN